MKISQGKSEAKLARLINMPKFKKTIPPDAKVDDTSLKESKFENQPIEASGLSSGHQDTYHLNVWNLN